MTAERQHARTGRVDGPDRSDPRRTMLGVVLLLLAFCWMGQATAPDLLPRIALPIEMASSPRVELPPSGDAWTGAPPAPGHYVRATRPYRIWKMRFIAALAELEHRRQMAEAEALRAWLTAYENTAVRRAVLAKDSGGMPAAALFTRRAVRRVIEPPPAPAFEQFYGYKVVLPWNGAVYTYDANAVPLDSPYLLHENGVKDGGTPVRGQPDIHMLFACAGVTDPVAKDVLIKVSAREGGFDAVNTWDTGYVSVGFIQFTTGEDGAGHSLLHVLERMKADEARLAQPEKRVSEFTRYFTDHGIDVRDGQLYVRDPATGETKSGADAVQLIIDDKRMTAVLQDAGAKSWAFKLAQIREAYGAYYLADAPFRIPAAEVCSYEVTAPAKPDDPAPAKPADLTPAKPVDPAPGTPAPPALPESAGTAPLKPVHPIPEAPPTPPEPRLTARHCVYGQQAVADAQAGALTPEAFAEQARKAPPGTVLRVARRLPDLAGTYGEVLDTEGGQVTLTDRAVQHGVRSTMDFFASCVDALAPDHPLTLEELRLAQRELIARLKNRIDVLETRAPSTEPAIL